MPAKQVRFLRDETLFQTQALSMFDNLPEAPARKISAILLPHIYRGWGAETYRAAAAALKASPPPDVVYIFGFMHYGPNRSPFHGTLRSYHIGSRLIEVCQPTMELLAKATGGELFHFEREHDRDWTIENALPALLKGCGEFPLFVPIIVDYRHGMFDPGYDRTRLFVEAAAESIKRHTNAGHRVLLAAAVDLSHIGRFFGDPAVDSARDASVRRFDQGYLERAFQIQPEQAETFIGRNLTRSDAPGPVGVMLRILRTLKLATSGELIHYDVYHGREDDRWVSLAAGVFC